MTSQRYAGAVAAALLALSLAACDSGTVEQRDPTGTPTAASATPSVSASPSAATETMAVAVYYLNADNGFSLSREFRRLPKTTAVVRTAVDAMLHLKPLDPDYSSMWPAATQIRGITIAGDLATVDLTKEGASAKTGALPEGRSLDQLVYTVSAAAPAVKRVQLLFEGKKQSAFWGHAEVDRPIARASHVNVLAPITIDSPAEGAVVGRRITFKGEATVPEANVTWRISTGCPVGVTCVGKPTVFKEGFTTASTGPPGRGTWSVTLDLPDEIFETSGYIEIRAFYSSDDDGSEQNPDTKVVLAKDQ